MAELPSYYRSPVDKAWVNAALAASQLGAAGLTVLLRASRLDSSSRFVFPLYQNCIGFLVLAPLAYFVERDRRPEIRFSTVCRLFILGSIGVVVNQVAYVTSSNFAVSSFMSSIDSVTPLVTFILAAACWIEDVHLRRRDGQAKVFAVCVSFLGAMIMSLGKGPALVGLPDTSSLSYLLPMHQAWELISMSLIGSISLAIYLILQVPILTRYPAPLSVAAFSSLFAVLELAVLALIFERDASKWMTRSLGEVYVVVYAGLIGTALLYGTQSWGILRGGPVLVAIYQPLKMVFLCFLGTFFLRLPFYLSSVIGAILSAFGVYFLLWAREEQRRVAARAPVDLVEPLWGMD